MKDSKRGPESRFSNLQRGLLVAAALCTLYLPIDAGKAAAHVVVAWRVAWIAALLAAAAAQSPERPRLARLAGHGAALVSGVATVGILRAVGGSVGPAFGFLMALPLVVLALGPEEPWAAALAGASTGGGGIFILLEEGRDAAFVGEWALLSLAVTALAVTGALGFRRVWVAELSAERERAEAMERLARSERLRSQAERLATVGRLVAGVAHEINSPLCLVQANVDWVAGRLSDGRLTVEEARQVLDDTRVGVDRIGRIVSDLSGLSREGPDEAGPCDAAAALAEALRLASTRLHGMSVRRTIEPDLPLAWASHRSLSQALVNLLVNAADAARQSDPERHWVKASAFREGDALVLAVEDGGHGLRPGTESLVFEPFFTTKGPKGTGLGLALAREQVARCRGTLEVANGSGGGARFTIRLQLAGSVERG